MNKRKAILSFLLTFIILVGGMGAYKMLGEQKKTSTTINSQKEVLRTVQVQQIQPRTANNYVEIDGRLTAFQKVHFSANVSGILLPASKVLKKGLAVKKGELLFAIDQQKAVFQLHAQRSALLNAISTMMPDLKLDYPEAFVKWNDYLNVFEVEKPVPELPELSYEKEKFFVAARNIYNLYYNIKSAEAQLLDYKIYAPFSGVISQVNVFPGTMVMPGQPLAVLTSTAFYELEAPVSEKEISFVKPGNPVTLNSTSTPEEWTGKVVRIASQIDPSTQSIPVYIRVSDPGLKEGMYLQGRIQGQALQEVITLQKELLVKQKYIYTVQDSILQLQGVDIQSQDKDHIYIKALPEGTWIVQENPRGLFEGQKVIPVVKRE